MLVIWQRNVFNVMQDCKTWKLAGLLNHCALELELHAHPLRATSLISLSSPRLQACKVAESRAGIACRVCTDGMHIKKTLSKFLRAFLSHSSLFPQGCLLAAPHALSWIEVILYPCQRKLILMWSPDISPNFVYSDAERCNWKEEIQRDCLSQFYA